MPQLISESLDPVVEGNSQPYIGQWRQLVSTTNWDKGRIIVAWRHAIEIAGGKLADFGDEAWSRMVGGVTPQHVGRLRRVHERFADSHDSYEGLYWSHFHAALEWEDAEMWLEGAVQNDWSVSRMRKQRWETLGGDEPREQDEVLSEWNEDLPFTQAGQTPPDEITGTIATVQDAGPVVEWEQQAAVADPDENQSSHKSRQPDRNEPGELPESSDLDTAVRPFARLATLPADLQEAFDAFKLAVLRHKLAGWRDISRDDLLDTLEALKQLALAPSN